MVPKKKKKSYSKRKTEDYIFSRKIKFLYSRFLKILQVLAVIAILGSIIWASRPDNYQKLSDVAYEKGTNLFILMGLRIASVEIEGNKIVPANLIMAKTFEVLGDISEKPKSIILIDIESLREKLVSIGWVESVEIRRKLPSVLLININERKPSVIWQSGGKVWLADKYGNLLSQNLEKQYMGLLLAIGGDSKKDIPELFNIINSDDNLAQLVVGATKIGNRRWDIMLKNNIKIKLPENDPITSWEKLAELEKKNALFSKNINYIDMRIENELVTGMAKDETNEMRKTKEGLAAPIKALDR